MNLKIPKYLDHNGERFMLHSVNHQKIEAMRLGRKLEKQRKRFRIKHIKGKFVLYFK